MIARMTRDKEVRIDREIYYCREGQIVEGILAEKAVYFGDAERIRGRTKLLKTTNLQDGGKDRQVGGEPSAQIVAAWFRS